MTKNQTLCLLNRVCNLARFKEITHSSFPYKRVGKGLLASIVGFAFFGLSLVTQANVVKPTGVSSNTKSTSLTIATHSMEIPSYLVQHLNKNQLYQLITELNDVKVYTPEQFYVYLRNGLTTVLSASENSLVLLTDRNVTKVSLFGLHKEPFWNLLLQSTTAEVRRTYALRTSDDATRIQREILGQILWRTYDRYTYSINAISSDLQALQRPHEYGRTLKEILSNPYLYAQHGPRAQSLWAEVIRIQKLAETMLLETGLSVDLRSASNFIVRGQGDSTRISNIDYELILPNQATRNYYRVQGKKIPSIQVPQNHRTFIGRNDSEVRPTHIHFHSNHTRPLTPLDLNIPRALLSPSAILISPDWSLTPEQAQDYLQVRFGVSKEGAVRLLEQVPKYKKNVPTLKMGRCQFFLN